LRALLAALTLIVVTFAMSNGAPTLSCTQCHVDAKAIPPKDLVVEGIPKYYEPGKIYNITVKILDVNPCNPEVMAGCGGFAVHPSAGELVQTDKVNTIIAHNPVDGVYITHSERGHMKREWRFAWKAPSKPQPVEFKVAALAANGDATPFGDYYGAKVIKTYPVGWTGPANGGGAGTGAPEVGVASSSKVLKEIKNLLLVSIFTQSVTLAFVIALLALNLLKKRGT